jgi:hypothetical protein
MNRLKVWMLATVFVSPLLAFAQLPAPNAEEAAQKAAAAEKKAAGEEAAKAALAKAQDRVAGRYRATHPNAPRPVPVAAAAK